MRRWEGLRGEASEGGGAGGAGGGGGGDGGTSDVKRGLEEEEVGPGGGEAGLWILVLRMDRSDFGV